MKWEGKQILVCNFAGVSTDIPCVERECDGCRAKLQMDRDNVEVQAKEGLVIICPNCFLEAAGEQDAFPVSALVGGKKFMDIGMAMRRNPTRAKKAGNN